jgi:adenylate cyclase
MLKTIRHPVFILSVVFTGITIIAYTMGIHFLEIIELKTVDYRFIVRGEKKPGNEVVLAVVDEKSLDTEGQWVWPRSKFAKLVTRLSDAGAKVIGFDIGFHEPENQSVLNTLHKIQKTFVDQKIQNQDFQDYLHLLEKKSDNDKILADAIINSKSKVVLGWFFHDNLDSLSHLNKKKLKEYEDNIHKSRYQFTHSKKSVDVDLSYINEIAPEPNIPILSDTAAYSGFFNFRPDIDGSFRQTWAVRKYNNELYAPLSMMVLSAYFDQPLHLEIGSEGEVSEACIGNDLCIPTDEDGSILINYRGEDLTFPHFSISDILCGKIPDSALRDKIVLIGATAVGIYDLRVTPLSANFPGLEIHANIIDAALARDFLDPPSAYHLLNLLVILFSGMTLGHLLNRAGVISGSLIAFSMIGGYAVFCIFLFMYAGGILNMVYPILLMMFVYIAVTAYKYFMEEGQKRFIRNAFSTYLAPSVVKQLIESPEKLVLGGEQREITAFFSDIQGFTGISEKLSPHELVELLNIFLTEMTDIILKYEGTVDKFEGDAIIAFFGAPNTLENHAETATAACIDMQKKMSELRKIWNEQGKPELKMRIGLFSGPAVVGNMGSKNRMDYTMMGDTVNTASRLEGVNKIYGIYTLIGDTTYHAAKNKILAREIDSINVVGKKVPVTIFEPIDFINQVNENMIQTIDFYSKGLLAYRSQNWNQAIRFFTKALEVTPEDGPSKTMIRRCKEFMENPPGKDWNGSYTMKTK